MLLKAGHHDSSWQWWLVNLIGVDAYNHGCLPQSCPFGKNRGAGDGSTIYHHYLLRQWARFKPLLYNQPTDGKRTSMVCIFKIKSDLEDISMKMKQMMLIMICFKNGDAGCGGGSALNQIWKTIISFHTKENSRGVLKELWAMETKTRLRWTRFENA